MKSLRIGVLVMVAILAALTSGCRCNECPDPENPACATDCEIATINILSPTEGTRFGLDDDTSGGSMLPAAITTEVVVEALDATGNPVAGATLRLTTNGGGEVSATTDANGLATFTDFPLSADPDADDVVNLLEVSDDGTCANDASTVSVDVAPPACTFAVPEANFTFICDDDADGMPLNGIQTNVTVSSDAGNGSTIRVIIDGDTTNPLIGTLTGGSATLSATLEPGTMNPVSLQAECVDDAGNIGTETIGVTVDCEVPLCTIDALVPGGGADLCIDLADGEGAESADITLTGLSGSVLVDLYVANSLGTFLLGSTSTTTSSAAIDFTVLAAEWVDDPLGGLDVLTCEATESAGGSIAFPVSFPAGCVLTDTDDAAPNFSFPLCPRTFNISEDSDAGTPGFQYDFSLQVCCVDYTLEVDCGAGPVVYTPPGTPAGPDDPMGCALITISDIDIAIDTPCTFTTFCVDDSTGTVSPDNLCSGFYVSTAPVLNITAPTAGTLLGVADDADIVAPDFQVNVTVASVGLTTGVDEIEVDDGAGGTLGPTTFTTSPTSFVATYTTDGTYTLTATSPTDATAVPSTIDITIDLTPPLPPTGLSCMVLEARTGEIQCTWIVPCTSGVDQLVVRWGDDPMTFDFATTFNASVVVSAPSPCTATPQTFTFFGPRIGDDLVVAVASEDAADNPSTPTTPFVVGPLQPSSVTLTDPAGAVGDALGAAVAGGDFNCDGNDDLAASAPFTGGGFGRVLFWFGQGSGTALGGAPDHVLDPAVGNLAYLGAGMATIGDWNGDGCDDLAIAAPGWAQVRIVLGSATLPATISELSGLRVSAPLLYASFQFGYGFYATSALAGGDLDGDGLADLVIGCDDCPLGGALQTGQAFVFLGTMAPGSGAIAAATADVTLQGDAAGDAFGSSVAYLGAIAPGGPGAGRGLAVGAPQLGFYSGSSDGYAAVFEWPLAAGPLTPAGSAIAVLDAVPGAAGTLGSSVAGTANFGGGGALGGVAIGGRDYFSGQGRVFVFLNGGTGLSSGTTAGADLTMVPPTVSSTGEFGLGLAGGYVAGGSLGGTVASFDSDGFADIIGSLAVGGDSCRVSGLYGDAVPAVTPPYDFCFAGPGGAGYDPVFSLSYFGDPDGNTFLDIAQGYPTAGTGPGSVIVYY